MFREVIQFARKLMNKAPEGDVVQLLLDKEKIRMVKLSEYIASDHDNKVAFTYKFYFDNMSRKRRFLAATRKYPPQPWDVWVKWMDEISVLSGEIIVEAQCLVPQEELGRFRHTFEAFVTKKLVLED